MKISLEEIKNAIIYVTPNFSDGETVRYKFKLIKILLWSLIYTTSIIVITTVILGVTPLKNLVYHFDTVELKEQAEKTLELENKIIFLTEELKSISSTNKKLEYAFILATSDSIDTASVLYDSLKFEPNENLPYGGNLQFIINTIINSIEQKEKSITNYFVNPSRGLIINEFNPKEGHLGIDFAVQTGSEILASMGGLVIFSDFTINDGHKLIIQHDNGFITIYKHCSTLIKKEREFVVQGELIGLSGNSGKNTTGPHLHFEIWKDGKPMNPKEFFIK